MSVPLLIGAGEAFPQRDLLIFIAAGVILLSLLSACIALPLLLRGITQSPDERLQQEVREAWRLTAEAAIHALEAEEVVDANAAQDAAQATLAVELKARLMAEYRDELASYNDSAEARELAHQMDLLERRLRLRALRAQRLELYSLHRQHLVGDEVVRQVLGDLDMSEANLGQVR
jgi:CPA1 family monovalent cation:H+ antiporter